MVLFSFFLINLQERSSVKEECWRVLLILFRFYFLALRICSMFWLRRVLYSLCILLYLGIDR